MPLAVKLAFLIPLLPLLGAAISGFAGARWLKQRSHWPIWLSVGASAALSLWLLATLAGQPAASRQFEVVWFTWIQAGSFVAQAGAWLDTLSVTMLCVVTGIGFLIMLFSRGYMAGEEGYYRFFAYLGLFIFAMTVLVMANNFVMLYLGWEGVGLCSYLLIGYYYQKPSAREAAKKAFLVNRVGDFGFALGILLIFTLFGTVNYFSGPDGGALIQATASQHALLGVIPFCLMLGAFGKSAQIPLYVWLPDAMEGPTPVSALIHAATMVTAGVYMIARCGVLFAGNHAATLTIALVGALTAIFAAVIALRQFDLKKIFAYSTISQLGYMFVGVAVLAPVAGMFHLVTHAFFKALLFLASGVVMHAMAGELDLRKMSGLRRVLPWTNRLMLVGCLALAGVPPFAGFFSKDEVLHAAFSYNAGIGLILLAAAFLTAYYTFRLYFRVFWGPELIPAAPEHGHGHAAEHHNPEPAIMIAPLVILAAGAALGGLFNWHDALGEFLGDSPSLRQGYEAARCGNDHVAATGFGQVESTEHGGAGIIMLISTAVAVAGVGLAYRLHLRDRRAAQRLAEGLRPLTGIIEARFFVDEFHQRYIVEPLRGLGRVAVAIDDWIIDGLIWLVGFVPQATGTALKLATQRGSLQGYATAMVFGIVVILLLLLL
jgi:NADH-quinone oxidoreductase subunit L